MKKPITIIKGTITMKHLFFTSSVSLLVCCLYVSGTEVLQGSEKKEKDGSAFLFGPGKIWTFHIKIQPGQWKKMQSKQSSRTARRRPGPGGGNRRDKNSREEGRQEERRRGGPGPSSNNFEYVEADVEFGGMTFEKVGLRYKGNSSFRDSANTLKRPFKIDFTRFVKGRKCMGISKLNFSNNFADPDNMREVLSYELFREAGIPASRTAYAKIYLTVEGKYDNKYIGLYTMVEQVDKNFLNNRFKTRKGLLVKPRRIHGFSYLGDEWEPYKRHYNPKTDVGPAEALKLVAFTKFVDKSDDAAFQDSIGSWMDLKSFARFLAFNVLLADFDSFLATDQNYYLYLKPGTKQFIWIPWDLNMSFGGFPGVGSMEDQMELSIEKPYTDENRLLGRIMQIESFKKLYLEQLKELSTKVFKEDHLIKRIDFLGKLIRPIVEKKPGQKSGRRGMAGFGKYIPLKKFVVGRIKSIKEQLAGKSKGKMLMLGGPGGRRDGPGGGFPPFLAGDLISEIDVDKDQKATLPEFMKLSGNLFKKWDSKKDELLDLEEIRAGINSIIPPPSGGRRPPRFEEGQERDGEKGENAPAPGEEIRFPGPGGAMASVMLENGDSDHNKKLSQKEFKNFLQRFFEKCDSDESKSLDSEELGRGLFRQLLPHRRGNGPGEQSSS